MEFMVDSGAGATVIGPADVKAVEASDPDPNKNFKIANGDIFQHMGQKSFNAVTEDEQVKRITAQVTEVDKPLLSVHQIGKHRSTVVLSPSWSYIDSLGGRRLHMESAGNVHMLTQSSEPCSFIMWTRFDLKRPLSLTRRASN